MNEVLITITISSKTIKKNLKREKQWGENLGKRGRLFCFYQKNGKQILEWGKTAGKKT